MPIRGMTKLEHLKEKLGAVDLDRSPEDLPDTESVYSKIKVQGARTGKMDNKNDLEQQRPDNIQLIQTVHTFEK